MERVKLLRVVDNVGKGFAHWDSFHWNSFSLAIQIMNLDDLRECLLQLMVERGQLGSRQEYYDKVTKEY